MINLTLDIDLEQSYIPDIPNNGDRDIYESRRRYQAGRV
jgi:hypothetical protein